MRLVQYLQVILLLALAGYVVLVQLENPVRVRLPLPGRADIDLPLGLVLACTLLAGALYASLLYWPGIVRGVIWRRHFARERRALQEQLSVTLQAKLAGRPAASQWSSDAPDDDDQGSTVTFAPDAGPVREGP